MAMPEKKERSYLILFLVFIILSAGIVATGYLYYRNYEKHYRTEVERQLLSVADMKTEQLVDWRKERLGDAAVFYENDNFSARMRQYLKRPGDTEAQTKLRTWISQFHAAYQYDRIFLLDTKGVELMSVPETHEPVAPHLLQHLSEILWSGKVTFLDFHRHSPDRSIHLSILIPILDRQVGSRAIGLLVFRIDPQKYLYPLISRWPTPSKTAEAMLVRRDGNDALFLNELKFQKNTALNLRIPIEKTEILSVKAVLGQKGVVEGKDYRGESAIGAVRAVPDSPWFLVARMDTSEVYTPLREQLWIMVILVGALLIGAGAGIGAIWRHKSARFYRERYEASEALLAISSRQEAILSAVPDIIMEVDSNKVYTWSNQAGREFFGEDVIGREAAYYFEGEQETYKTVKPLFNGNENIIYVESWQRRKDGQKRLLAWWCRVLKDKSGNVTGALSTARDITEIKWAEEEIKELNAELEQRVIERTAQLESTNKELEAFSYSVSHDLRAPLRAIHGFSNILNEDFSDKLDDEGKRCLKIISDSTNKMGELIDDLLAFSRIGRTEIRLSMIEMDALVKSAFEELKPLLTERKLQFNIDNLLFAQGDRSMIRQVIINLLSNAIKFTGQKEAAVIHVGGYSEGDENIYYVRDNGVGFDMQYVHKLFAVFQRLHSDDEFEGTGIGLALVKRIISKHGGRVWAEGKINEGATFYFSLPGER